MNIAKNKILLYSPVKKKKKQKLQLSVWLKEKGSVLEIKKIKIKNKIKIQVSGLLLRKVLCCVATQKLQKINN